MRLSRSRKQFSFFKLFVGALSLFFLCGLFFLGQYGFFSHLFLFFADTPESEFMFLPREELVSRLIEKEEELLTIRYQGALYAHLIREKEALEDAFTLPRDVPYARGVVIATPPRTYFDTLLVAIRDSRDIALSDRVFAFGYEIGRVGEITPSGVVKVSLYSSPSLVSDARVGDPSAIVSLYGMGGGAFSFEIPKSINVAIGSVVTSVSGTPRAVVARVIDIPKDANATIEATFPFSFSDIRFVEFVRKDYFFESETETRENI